jgi:hypothetical protein
MRIRYFSAKVCPHIHDLSLIKEGFGDWKEEFMRSRVFVFDEKRMDEFRVECEAEQRAELENERKMHAKTRSDVIIKYFSEKVSPAVHDSAAKKEAFGMWKQEYFWPRSG